MKPDLLDHVVDNRAERRREIWRNGRIVATAQAGIETALMRRLGAGGPWGTYPDRLPSGTNPTGASA
jgi:hypothetical protein